MVLITRFYHAWRTEGWDASEARRIAQRWTAQTTNGEKAEFFRETWARNTSVEAANILRSLEASPEERDLAHPIYWAAFTYVGA